jgi:hypothetical protein
LPKRRSSDLRGLPAGAEGTTVPAFALWVVPREAIVEVGEFVDELNRNYHRVDGYSLKDKLRRARERAGSALVARDS